MLFIPWVIKHSIYGLYWSRNSLGSTQTGELELACTITNVPAMLFPVSSYARNRCGGNFKPPRAFTGLRLRGREQCNVQEPFDCHSGKSLKRWHFLVAVLTISQCISMLLSVPLPFSPHTWAAGWSTLRHCVDFCYGWKSFRSCDRSPRKDAWGVCGRTSFVRYLSCLNCVWIVCLCNLRTYWIWLLLSQGALSHQMRWHWVVAGSDSGEFRFSMILLVFLLAGLFLHSFNRTLDKRGWSVV